MMSCGFRSLWRARVFDNGEAGGGAYDYDKLVLPLLCVCGPVVYVGAGVVTENFGAPRVGARVCVRVYVSARTTLRQCVLLA